MSQKPASASPGAVVRKTLVVDCAPEHAFAVFTRNMGRWWPATHHVGATPFRDVIVEPRSGGRWYEINAEDEEGQWGHVLAWEPPQRVVLSWHLGTTFAYDPDLAHASELDIRFHAAGDNRTRVEFEHRHIERHGEGYEKLRDVLDGGWVGILDEFAKRAAAAEAMGPAQ
jgi:uncharacterized protein YndB with AHSA1/START domain